ncbi:hypothetical protein ARMGADRAFT_1162754 [Armillaria gallica]|uniref:Protein kinase domain-containing protein n=1 Tax=Armillaria gallica TaxID=47427 RepID=A0A2H3EBR1_ARMGA|nr:hypothetical protein ARMGADRAFT_1162754 [Armillaria gallica]
MAPFSARPSRLMSRSVQIILGRDIVESPERTDSENSDSDSDSDGARSDGTIEDIDSYPRWGLGHPLQRMVRIESSDDDASSYYRSGWSSCDSESDSSTSTSSSVVFDIDYESLIDDLLLKDPGLYESSCLVMVEPSTPTSNDSLMIKSLSRTSPELFLLLEFNHPEYRTDPWNPFPHILCAVERGEKVFLCLQRLFQFDKPPFRNVANYLDFLRQSLEGLTFLHEHYISELSCFNFASFMVDIGAGTRSTISVEHFDRSKLPVKYYYANLSSAVQDTDHSEATYIKDVKECGVMIDRLLFNLPKVGPKLKSLVNAMTSGGFGADDSRKLFEALCKSLESSVFDLPVPPRDLSTPLNAPTMTRTRSHPITNNYDASTVTLVPPPQITRSQSNPKPF